MAQYVGRPVVRPDVVPRQPCPLFRSQSKINAERPRNLLAFWEASIRTSTSGTHQVRYRDPNGRQRARNFSRKTDATRFAAAVETDKLRGDWLDPRLGKVNFAEWAEEWLGQLGHLKPKTRLDYEVALRRHVMPVLG